MRQRRERRLRSAWRHEQVSVAMALAAAAYQSAQSNDACGDRSDPPGERPVPLSEVAGPQRTVRRSGGFSPGLLSFAGGSGVDGTIVSVLLRLALKKQEEEERKVVEKGQKKQKDEDFEKRMLEPNRRVRSDLPRDAAELAAWRPWSDNAFVLCWEEEEEEEEEEEDEEAFSSFLFSHTEVWTIFHEPLACQFLFG